ncbi:hypothetical protein KSP39_PZI019503 [Platanthera zijinensis]|uniref:Uncharacterized protein n=1 Tax=Platanthera zijinensis TaxID=2320716 RepID=A0AAP0FYD3_9ASPA
MNHEDGVHRREVETQENCTPEEVDRRRADFKQDPFSSSSSLDSVLQSKHNTFPYESFIHAVPRPPPAGHSFRHPTSLQRSEFGENTNFGSVAETFTRYNILIYHVESPPKVCDFKISV